MQATDTAEAPLLSIADGPIGAGPASEFAGLYELQEGHVNMQPAWRRVRAIGGGPCESHRSLEGSLWLVRGRNGCWVGQKDSQLSRDAGSLQLAHTGFLSPVEASSGGADGGGGRVVWEEYANKAWRAVPGLRCSLADEADVAAMKVAAANLGSAEEAAAMGKEAGGKGSHDHEHTDISDPHGHDEHAHHGHAHGHADCCGHDHGHDEHGCGAQQEHGDHEHGPGERIGSGGARADEDGDNRWASKSEVAGRRWRHGLSYPVWHGHDPQQHTRDTLRSPWACVTVVGCTCTISLTRWPMMI